MRSPVVSPGTNRREFLSRVGGTAAAAAGMTVGLPASVAAGEDDDDDFEGRSRRAREAYRVRVQAARFQMEQGTSRHPTNGDERR